MNLQYAFVQRDGSWSATTKVPVPSSKHPAALGISITRYEFHSDLPAATVVDSCLLFLELFFKECHTWVVVGL